MLVLLLFLFDVYSHGLVLVTNPKCLCLVSISILSSLALLSSWARCGYLCGSCDLEDLHGASDDVLDSLLSDPTEEHRGDLPQGTLGWHGLLTRAWLNGRRQQGLLLLLSWDSRHPWLLR